MIARLCLLCLWVTSLLACVDESRDAFEARAERCPAYEGPGDLEGTSEYFPQASLNGPLVEHVLDHGLRVATPEGWQAGRGLISPPEATAAYLVGFVSEEGPWATVSITCTSGPVRMPGGSMFDGTTPMDPAEIGMEAWLRIELRSRLELVLDRVVNGELSPADQAVALTTLGAVPADLSADPEVIVEALMAGIDGPRQEDGREVVTIPGGSLTVPSHFILTQEGNLVMAVGSAATSEGRPSAADVAVATAVMDSVSFGDTGCGCPQAEGPAVLR